MEIFSEIQTVLAGTASVVVLCVGLSGAPQRTHPSFGVRHMVCISTNGAGSVSYLVDPETEEYIKQKDDLLNFQNLVTQWRAERRATSLVADMVVHPAYQGIIGTGPTAVPFILHELRRSPDHWFWALRAITRENPVPEEIRGNMREMAAVWFAWGEAKGYV